MSRQSPKEPITGDLQMKYFPESYTSEGLRIIAGVTYIGDNSKARRELGYNPRPVSEGWLETIEYEMTLLGTKQP